MNNFGEILSIIKAILEREGLLNTAKVSPNDRYIIIKFPKETSKKKINMIKDELQSFGYDAKANNKEILVLLPKFDRG